MRDLHILRKLLRPSRWSMIVRLLGILYTAKEVLENTEKAFERGALWLLSLVRLVVFFDLIVGHVDVGVVVRWGSEKVLSAGRRNLKLKVLGREKRFAPSRAALPL